MCIFSLLPTQHQWHNLLNPNNNFRLSNNLSLSNNLRLNNNLSLSNNLPLNNNNNSPTIHRQARFITIEYINYVFCCLETK